jgi:hypothetical protein
MLKKADFLTRPTPARRDVPFHGRGRSKRGGEAYAVRYVECLSAAITRQPGTRLAGFFSILLEWS